MDFFDAFNWPILILFGLTFFPRLTLLVGVVADVFISGGVLWWLGWIFCPHLLVAFLSLPFWDTNPGLVICAWVIALGGTTTEGRAVSRKKNRQ